MSDLAELSLYRRIHNPVLEQPFRVRLAATPNRPVRSQVEMHDEDAVERVVEIRHHDGSRSGWLVRASSRIGIGQAAAEFAALRAVQVISLGKASPQLRLAHASS